MNVETVQNHYGKRPSLEMNHHQPTAEQILHFESDHNAAQMNLITMFWGWLTPYLLQVASLV